MFITTDISIIIPTYNSEKNIKPLLDGIKKQSLYPREIIIIDSSNSNKLQFVLQDYLKDLPITYKKINFSFPGRARNFGVSLSKGKWIAFLDTRTIPLNSWLKESFDLLEKDQSEYISGLMYSHADTYLKKTIKAITYGNKKTQTVPGTIILRSIFNKTKGFPEHVRAGEDIEWVNQLKKLDIKKSTHLTPTIVYDGFPDTLYIAIKKWFIYYMASAEVDIKEKIKIAYLFILLFLLFIVFFNWNFILAGWNEDSIFYIPNITKSYLSIVFFTYIIFRGLLKPLMAKESLKYLLPFNWIAAGFLGLLFDIIKAPGLIYGAILYIKKNIINFFMKN